MLHYVAGLVIVNIARHVYPSEVLTTVVRNNTRSDQGALGGMTSTQNEKNRALSTLMRALTRVRLTSSVEGIIEPD